MKRPKAESTNRHHRTSYLHLSMLVERVVFLLPFAALQLRPFWLTHDWLTHVRFLVLAWN